MWGKQATCPFLVCHLAWALFRAFQYESIVWNVLCTYSLLLGKVCATTWSALPLSSEDELGDKLVVFPVNTSSLSPLDFEDALLTLKDDHHRQPLLLWFIRKCHECSNPFLFVKLESLNRWYVLWKDSYKVQRLTVGKNSLHLGLFSSKNTLYDGMIL